MEPALHLGNAAKIVRNYKLAPSELDHETSELLRHLERAAAAVLAEKPVLSMTVCSKIFMLRKKTNEEMAVDVDMPCPTASSFLAVSRGSLTANGRIVDAELVLEPGNGAPPRVVPFRSVMAFEHDEPVKCVRVRGSSLGFQFLLVRLSVV